MINKLTPNNFDPTKDQCKDTEFQAQKKIVFQAFYDSPKTMMMVSVETGILRTNITRYVAEWRKQGLIHHLRTGICPVTKHTQVGYLTTDPEKMPVKSQLSLF